MSKGKTNPKAAAANKKQEEDVLKTAGEAVNKGADTLASATERVLDRFQQFTDKFVSTQKPIHIKDAVGREAEVSVTIPANGSGEVILSLGGALRHYPARGKDGRKSFKRGLKVKVVDAASDTMYVDEA